MPAYISHAIMANDVYNKLNNKNISLDYMLTYSLGGDLARFSKCRRTCHKEKTEEFIDNMWNYLKENNLTNSSIHLGVLYGHICHYYMDLICHPLIRSLDKACINIGRKNHTLIEGYIDSFLVKSKYKIDIEKFKTKYIFKGKISKISKLINYTYEKTYNVKHLSFSYFITKFLYSKIRWLFILFRKKLLIKISSFNKFKKTNKNINLLNTNKKIEYINHRGNKCNNTFIDLYNESIDASICHIKSLK